MPFIGDTYTGPLLLCWKERERDGGYLHPDFSFAVFQIAMKHYHQGRDYSNLLKVLSRNTRVSPNNDYIWQCKSLAQIVAGSLLFRDQTIIGIPPSKQNEGFSGIRIGPHIRISSKGPLYHKDATEVIRAKYQSYARCRSEGGSVIVYTTCRNGSLDVKGMTQCKYCWTEFQVDFTGFETSVTGIFITRWKDRGSRRSPDEPKWRSQNCPSVWDTAEFELGSIYSAFEQKVDSKFEFKIFYHLRTRRCFLQSLLDLGSRVVDFNSLLMLSKCTFPFYITRCFCILFIISILLSCF